MGAGEGGVVHSDLDLTRAWTKEAETRCVCL